MSSRNSLQKSLWVTPIVFGTMFSLYSCGGDAAKTKAAQAARTKSGTSDATASGAAGAITDKEKTGSISGVKIDDCVKEQLYHGLSNILSLAECNPVPAPKLDPVLVPQPVVTPTVAPSATPTATPTPTPTTGPKTDAELAKEANTRGFAVFAVSAADGVGWNTVDKPFLLAPTVNAAGAINTAKPFTAVFCNYSSQAMQLHSNANTGPMAHGNAFTGTGLGAYANLAAAQADIDAQLKAGKVITDFTSQTRCTTSLIASTMATAGATYNHRGGAAGNVPSRVFFKTMTVDPNGVVK